MKYKDSIMFRVSEEQRQKIVKASDLENMKISDFCRKTILDRTDDLIKNLNQHLNFLNLEIGKTYFLVTKTFQVMDRVILMAKDYPMFKFQETNNDILNINVSSILSISEAIE